MVWGPGGKDGATRQGVKDEARASEEKGAQGAGNTHLHEDGQAPRTGQVPGHSGSRGPPLPLPPRLEIPLSTYWASRSLRGTGDREGAYPALRCWDTQTPWHNFTEQGDPLGQTQHQPQTWTFTLHGTPHPLHSLEPGPRGSEPRPTQRPWSGWGSLAMWAGCWKE